MTTTMTCVELYKTDAIFAAGINTWVAERRCPFGLSDYLEELGLSAAADCARWASVHKDRKVNFDSKEMSGVYPGTGDEQYHRWACLNADEFCRDVPPKHIVQCLKKADSDTDAILWLLDNWKVRT